jgi:peptidoglycan/xylan/chitin deacetylase (PgdA/CDA1 family)
VDHVRTHDKVVFLTYDHEEGARRDPRFADLVRELRLPVTEFRTAPDRHHFAGLPYDTQRAEICGSRPRPNSRLLRPPYGTYDTTTRRAAADCGISALVLWRASATAGTLTYARGDHHLTPGDIVQVGPADSAARLLRGIQDRGLTVGRLEDYL